MSIHGTAGNDTLTGTSGNDTFDLSQGGNDTVSGLAGNDVFAFGATFTAADTVDGGAGSDALRLSGDYSAGVTFAATTMVNVENIQLDPGFSYNLTTNDANVASGARLQIDGHQLGAGNSLTFNGAAESNGHFNIIDGAGNDTVTGGTGNDTFVMTNGGTDSAQGGGGNDLFQFGAALTAADHVDGGTGSDTLELSGNYTGANAITFSATTAVSVENLLLDAGNSYKVVTDDATVASGQTFTVDASALGSGNSLTFDGAAESNGVFDIIGGAGNDVLRGGGYQGSGGSTTNTFDLSKGGEDTVTAGEGHNLVLMGGALDTGDRIDTSGSASTTVDVDGDYSAGVTLTSLTLEDVKTLDFGAGHDYVFTQQSSIGPLINETLDASALGAGDSINYNASGQTDGSYTFNGGAGTNIFSGGQEGDNAILQADVLNTIHMGGGNNTISVGSLTASDTLDGGGSNGIVNIDANVTVVLGATTITGAAVLNLFGADNITTNDATVASGARMIVSAGSSLGNITFNGGAETNGFFVVTGNTATDVWTGGTGKDTFNMEEKGANTITGGGGADTIAMKGALSNVANSSFIYNAVSDSTSQNFDSISGIVLAHDTFHVSGINGAVTGVDTAIHAGSLSSGTFDADLAGDITSSQLAAHHAVLFTPDAGSFSGQTFLIIDENGTAGYQAGADLVIHVTISSGTLTTANFS